MSGKSIFSEAAEKHLATLEQYVPIVARVHGGNHPEFHEVKRLFDSIIMKTKASGMQRPELDDEFARLREITDNYLVPSDVCESYQAVYNMLAEMDRAYKA